MKNDEFEMNLEKQLNELKQVPDRNPQVVARGKAAFLKQAVSLKASQRQTGWNNILFPANSQKERLTMLKPIIAVILVITILFGGTAGTVYAAQGSLPGQALYQVKTWSEDALQAVTLSPQAQLEQNLNFADRRILEIADLLAAGSPIPQQVQTRLQTELNQALNLAAGMEDQQMIMELERIRLRIETQLQMMSMLMASHPNSTDPIMAMVRVSLQQQLQFAARGETDTQGFRNQVQEQIQNQILAPSEPPDNGQSGPYYSHTTTPISNGQQNGYATPSGDGSGTQNYQTMTPMQYGTGQYNGQVTPGPENGKKP